MARCIELSRTRPTSDHIMDDQQRDLQGRIVGLRIVKFESEMVPATVENSNGLRLHNIEPGFYYRLQITTTRGGAQYGATRAAVFFDNPESRDAAVTRRIKSFWKNRRGQNVTT